MGLFKGIVLSLALLALVGCSSGLEVIKKPAPGDKMAIVMFNDCTQAMDCPGSGKKISDIYADVLGVPVVMFESDAKNFDVLLTGKITNYNEAVPMAFNANIVFVDLQLKKVSDNSLMAKQTQQAVGSNLFSSAKGLSHDLAIKLKDAIK